MINSKNSLIFTALLAIAFGGCGDDRSHPNDGTNPIVYKKPTAIIDVNGTAHIQQDVNGTVYTYRVDNNLSNPFIFNGNRSQDNDEANQSIVSYDWNITSSFSEDCLDINSTGDTSTVLLCNEAFTDGDINVTLKVTDDEGETATANTIIKIN